MALVQGGSVEANANAARAEAKLLFLHPPADVTELVARAATLLKHVEHVVGIGSSLVASAGIDTVGIDTAGALVEVLCDVFLTSETAFDFSKEQGIVISLFMQDFVNLIQDADYFRLMHTWVQSVGKVMDDGETAPNAALRVQLGGCLLGARPISVAEEQQYAGLLEAVIVCCASAQRERLAMIRSLLGPCVAMVLRATSTDRSRRLRMLRRLWEARSDLEGDLQAGSLIVCIVVQKLTLDSGDSIEDLFRMADYWDVVVSYFLHEDTVVRKRAAYLTEQFLEYHENTRNTGASAGSGMQGKISTAAAAGGAGSSGNKERRRGGRQQTRSSVLHATAVSARAEAVVAGAPEKQVLESNAPTPPRHWLHNFLSIYGQIEACRYIHLIEQVSQYP